MRLGLSMVMAAAALLAGCGSGGQRGAAGADADDRFAGLDSAIRAWRDDIVQDAAACVGDGPGQGCQGFEVACKAERSIDPQEAARGVSAKVVAGMSWQAWHADRGETMPAAGFVQFTNTDGTWSRSARLNGNLATCETFDTAPA